MKHEWYLNNTSSGRNINTEIIPHVQFTLMFLGFGLFHLQNVHLSISIRHRGLNKTEWNESPLGVCVMFSCSLFPLWFLSASNLCVLLIFVFSLFACWSLNGKWGGVWRIAAESFTYWREKHLTCGTLRFIQFSRAVSIHYCTQYTSVCVKKATLEETHRHISTPTEAENRLQ